MGMWNSFHTPITLTILGTAIRNSFFFPFSCPVYNLPPHYLYSQVLLSSFFFHTLTSFPPLFHEPSMVSLTAYETPCSWTCVLHQYEPSLQHTTTETPESQPTRHSCSKDALICVVSYRWRALSLCPSLALRWGLTHHFVTKYHAYSLRTTIPVSLLQSNNCKTPSGIVFAPFNTVKRSTEKTLLLCQ